MKTSALFRWLPIAVVLAATPFVFAGTYQMMLGCAGAPSREFNRVDRALLATDATVIAAEDHSFQFTPGPLMNTPFAADCPDNPDTTNYAEAEAAGARRVRVTYPGLSEPLYGVLSFCGVHPEYHGSASRSYRLEVPQSYVDETAGARVSVVYERYEQGGTQYPAWVLWLSREPMPHLSANPPVHAVPGEAQGGGGC
jgi:hypothetical protein